MQKLVKGNRKLYREECSILFQIIKDVKLLPIFLSNSKLRVLSLFVSPETYIRKPIFQNFKRP